MYALVGLLITPLSPISFYIFSKSFIFTPYSFLNRSSKSRLPESVVRKISISE
ncbi:hypothetical protein XBKB1_4210004 [Xenorhabdus bovienii str. kraussei Becker Underwood]|uniref:Uncharacterized protein n=1 Tax=Xenorhabdus bovienii str. kraussei Becker Underwood TaxID=1398204 RepID=A0A077PYR8_XENBV|nr:hypothetical protein XBKB1_4210004 [Xenorhabdus bovienii str. kraussei Becker Underwood]